jgi:hypothetical protein
MSISINQEEEIYAYWETIDTYSRIAYMTDAVEQTLSSMDLSEGSPQTLRAMIYANVSDLHYYYNESLKNVLERPGFVSNPKTRGILVQKLYTMLHPPNESLYGAGIASPERIVMRCSCSGASGMTGDVCPKRGANTSSEPKES